MMLPDSLRRRTAFVTSTGIFALDRGSKWLVETRLTDIDSKTVIPGFLNIVRSENPGIAFGIFQENPTESRTLILVAFSFIAVALLAAMLWRIDKLDNPSAVGVSLIFGGAAGNVFDRAHAGKVTDFLDFVFGSYHWYTFNIADAAIFCGACLLILSMVRAPTHKAQA